MKVIDCECGATLQAANEEDLTEAVKGHLASDHPDMKMSSDEVEGLVAQRSYDATDS